MGGVLDFATFCHSPGGAEDILEAVPAALGGGCSYDRGRLASLGSRTIQEREFFGDLYDAAGGDLLQIDSCFTKLGVKLVSRKLRTLSPRRFGMGSIAIPEPGSGGQFAYAFTHPPHSLSASPREVQEVFEAIRGHILPPGEGVIIQDWSSPALPEVSDYFTAGMEWWGVFLFSIHVSAIQRLTIIAGSTTD